MSDFLKPEKIVATLLGLLVRDLTLPQIVWRDPVGDFGGVKNDTISIRLPAYAPAHQRVMRAGTSRTKDEIHERKVDLTLDTDIYKWIGISDEELTLDIVDFGAQVLVPISQGIALGVEGKLASVITAASYENTITFNSASQDPYKDVAVTARQYLSAANVPLEGRSIICGSQLEASFLRSDDFVRADRSGTTQTLREALIGRVAGFDVYTTNAVAPDEAYAFHRTAYAMSSKIPAVPDGAPWGARQSYQGIQMRAVRAFDIEHVEDQLAFDSWLGAAAVKDYGHYQDDPDSFASFIPGEDPDAPITGHSDTWLNDSQRLVRAVKISVIDS